MNCFLEPDAANTLLDRRRLEHQTLAERILHRCELLEPADRALLESIYSDHVPIARLARVRGQSPRQVRRRVKRLIERLLCPTTDFVLARRREWEKQRWQAARLHLVAGRGLAETARDLGLTLHTVRKHVEAVRTLYEQHVQQAQQEAGRPGQARRLPRPRTTREACQA